MMYNPKIEYTNFFINTLIVIIINILNRSSGSKEGGGGLVHN
jgi:hypothetical protein